MRFFLFSVIPLLVHLLSAADVRLTVTVVDDCGNPVSNAVVVVQTLKSLVSTPPRTRSASGLPPGALLV